MAFLLLDDIVAVFGRAPAAFLGATLILPVFVSVVSAVAFGFLDRFGNSSLFLHSFFDFLLLLCHENLGDSGRGFLGGQKEIPQLRHENSCVLAVEKARQVNLHSTRIWILRDRVRFT